MLALRGIAKMIDFRDKPKKYEQGIYEMPFSQYMKIPALNSSKLKAMRRTPAHFEAAIRIPEEITPIKQRTFDKGTAFDILIKLGQDALVEKVAVEPALNKNTKEYKEFKKLAQEADKLILGHTELEDIFNMGKAAFNKQQFKALFTNGYPNKVLIWQDDGTKLWCKAEIDWITSDGVVVDLKTTADADFWFFAKAARRFGYINQAAFYLSGLTTVTGHYHEDYLLAAVEKEDPFESHIFRPSQAQILDARDENKDRMEQILWCLNKDSWPGYLDCIMDLDTGMYEDEDGEINEYPF